MPPRRPLRLTHLTADGERQGDGSAWPGSGWYKVGRRNDRILAGLEPSVELDFGRNDGSSASPYEVAAPGDLRLEVDDVDDEEAIDELEQGGEELLPVLRDQRSWRLSRSRRLCIRNRCTWALPMSLVFFSVLGAWWPGCSVEFTYTPHATSPHTCLISASVPSVS
ncbi:hypothetical protein C8T65DRAFT_829206, partial [Cerioporus squamosus]